MAGDSSQSRVWCILHGIAHQKRVYPLIGLEALERTHLFTTFTFASLWLLDYLKVHLLFMILTVCPGSFSPWKLERNADAVHRNTKIVAKG